MNNDMLKISQPHIMSPALGTLLNRQFSLAKYGAKWLALLALWNHRSVQRRQLTELVNEYDLLKDMGLSSYDALIESKKPFWRE